MEIKELIGETVFHKSFGKGVIKGAYDKYLEIDFPECNRQSRFIYPSCFDAFLMLEKSGKEQEVVKDLEQWKIDSGALQREKLRLQYEKTQQDIKERLSAAEEKKKKAGQRTWELRFKYNRA